MEELTPHSQLQRPSDDQQHASHRNSQGSPSINNAQQIVPPVHVLKVE
jgi:hypothetical protein